MRARQSRPRRRRLPGVLTAAVVRQRRLLEDDAPPTFSELRDFRQPWREWSPREDADFVRWCLTEDETSYDEAEAEMLEVVIVEETCPAGVLADTTETPLIAVAPAPTPLALHAQSTRDHLGRAA